MLLTTVAAQFDEWGLSDGERDIARRWLRGETTAEIAKGRGVQLGTVRQQAVSIYRKSGLRGHRKFLAHFAGVGARGGDTTCQFCRYFDNDGREDAMFGVCRVRPPVRLDNGDGAWPGVHEDDWCGEWKR